MAEIKPAHYFIDPLVPFPSKWRDRVGPIAVMTEPVKGYVMVRRPGCAPFVLRVSHLCNAEKHPIHGPFEVVGAKARRGKKAAVSSHKGADHG